MYELSSYRILLSDHVQKRRNAIKTSTDPETCCQSALEFVQEIRQLPIKRQETQIRPMLNHLQSALELCEFNGWHANDKTGKQLKTLSAFEIIVDILMTCSAKKTISRKTNIQNLYDDVGASSGCSPAFDRLVKRFVHLPVDLLDIRALIVDLCLCLQLCEAIVCASPPDFTSPRSCWI